MPVQDFSSVYKKILPDLFPKNMEISFYDEKGRQSLQFEKVEWTVDGEKRGLRYGENPDQEAALFKLVGGNLVLGDVHSIQSGRWLASQPELLQSGKHPGKTNITDADAALNILRYFTEEPAAIIIKHNNPCGVAIGSSIGEAYLKAYMADRVAAFGGCIAFNRTLDIETTKMILTSYCEVVVAPDFAPGVMDLFKTKPNIRVMQIKNMARLTDYANDRVLDLKSLMDGGVVAQWSFSPQARRKEDFFPAQGIYKGKEYQISRLPNDREWRDIIFGWLVEAGVTSNSVLYVKDGVTVGIGTGEQDRVGVAEIARDKAYRKLEDRISWEKYQTPFMNLQEGEKKQEIRDRVIEARGGLKDAIMVSDAFFPFRDGVDIGLNEGISAVVQPGGSLRDFEVIEACNERNVAMVYTGQRSFRH